MHLSCDSPIRRGTSEHRMKASLPIIADSRQKSVTIATSLERSRKKDRTDHADSYSVPILKMVKISQVHNDIIGFPAISLNR